MSHWIPHSDEWRKYRQDGDATGSILAVICNLTGKPDELYNSKITGIDHFEGNNATKCGSVWEGIWKPLWRERNPTRPLLARPPIKWTDNGVNYVLSVDGYLPMERRVWEQKTFYTDRPGGERYALDRLDVIRQTGLPLLKHRPQIEAYARAYECDEVVVSYVAPFRDNQVDAVDVIYKINDRFWSEFVQPLVKIWTNSIQLGLTRRPANLFPSRTDAIVSAQSYWL